MTVQKLILLLILNLTAVICYEESQRKDYNMPLNFVDALSRINKHSKIDKNEKLFDMEFNSLLNDNYQQMKKSLVDLISLSDVKEMAFPNVTEPCLIQLFTFYAAIKLKLPWTLTGLYNF